MKTFKLDKRVVSSVSKSNAKQSTRQFYTVKGSKGRKRRETSIS